jgi:hypothetical protein
MKKKLGKAALSKKKAKAVKEILKLIIFFI